MRHWLQSHHHQISTQTVAVLPTQKGLLALLVLQNMLLFTPTVKSWLGHSLPQVWAAKRSELMGEGNQEHPDPK